MVLWARMRRRPLRLIVGSLTFVIFFGLFVRQYSLSLLDLSHLKNPLLHTPSKHWSSFAQISTIFSFGDSWSSVGLELCEQYTTFDSHSFRNPDFPGVTSTNGPNWVGYLTHVFNQSVINTYNLAISGSTIDTDIVPGMWNKDLKYAIQQLTDPSHRCYFVPEKWDPATTLFTVFFGMNDVASCHEANHCDIYNPPMTEMFESYTKSLSTLYTFGARNFLLLDAPPVCSAAALGAPDGSNITLAQIRATKLFNEHHQALAQHLRTSLEGTTVFEYSVWELLQQIYFQKNNVPEANVYKNLNDICPFYGPFRWLEGNELTQAEIDLCGGLRPEEYLWNSPLHVTWPAHKAMARGVLDVMGADIQSNPL